MSFLDKITAQIPFGKKSTESEYFFALNIGLSEVTGIVWTLYGHQLDILGQATLPYEGTEDLLDKAYKSLDQALGILEIDPKKVLFGVPDSWSIEDNLKEPYLKLLRRMLKEYELEPMAYVTTTNAISHFLQKQEGVPQTVVLLGVGDFVEATLIRGGKVAESRTTKRTDQIFDDIEKVLRQFTEVEVLPSKILLYSIKQSEKLNKIKDDLMSYPWMQRLSFLHFPKIEELEGDIANQSLVFAGAVEISPQVSLKHSFTTSRGGGLSHSGTTLENTPLNRHFEQEEASRPYHKIGNHDQKPVVEPVLEGKEDEEDLGFIKGDIKEYAGHGDEDGIKLSENIHEPQGNLITPELPEDVEEMALMGTGKHLGRKAALTRMHAHGTHETSSDWQEPEYGVLDQGTSVVTTLLSKVKGFLKFPRRKKSVSAGIGGPVFIKILIGVGILGGLVAAYLFMVKASITIFVEPKILEKQTEVVADPKITAIDEEKKIIPGSVVETTLSGSGKGTATGTKQIGDPAKGKVIVYNLTSNKVSLSQGTVLTGGSGLKFDLGSSVQIASQSSSVGADFTTVTKPGKSDLVGVTAEAIGPDGNLSAGTDLSVPGYTKAQVIARVEESLSGGTSKTVTVVTADDQKKLQAKVVDELRQKSETDIQGKLTEGQKIISEALSIIDGKYNFNKQVNDQANEFSLTANVRFKGTAYKEADLRTIVSKLVGTDVPEGFELNLSTAETQADVAKVEKDGRLIFEAKFKAKLLPKYNLDDLRKKIRGKSVEAAASDLKSLDNVLGSEIKTFPSLPSVFSRLPLWDKNISITVTPK